ncbi:MAG TPA: 2-C-methyl-D-erythritol 4-phosphate cytidylyltransferase [Jiangellaceae bacterium]
MTIGLIVPAAGRGERLGAGVPKALLPLAGQPLLVHAVRGALSSRVVDVVVVAAPADRVAEVRGLLDAEVTEVRVVSGGDDRRESVARALAELPPEVDAVLVHDAARCLTPPAVFAAIAAALAGGAAAVVPAVPVADTVKQVAHGVVVGTPDRDTLRAVQTPQGFRRDVLERAHATEPGAATDDAGLAERLGFEVRVVAGHEEAFKITRSLDLVLAEAILDRRARAGAP